MWSFSVSILIVCPVAAVSQDYCHLQVLMSVQSVPCVAHCLLGLSVGAAVAVAGQTVAVLTSAVVTVAVLPLHGPVAVSLT